MAHEIPVLVLPLKATNDLSAKQFRFVKVDTANDDSILVAAASADNILGVLQTAPTAAQVGTVMVYGLTKVLTGASVTRGDFLMSDANGAAITWTGGFPAIAQAFESAGSGTLVSALLFPRSVGQRIVPLSFQIDLAAIANGAGPTNIYTFTPGVAGRIISCSFTVNVPATTAAKLGTLTTGVGATATTGGAVALTSVNCTPMGNEVKGSAITALNAFSATQAVTVIASTVTAFVEGSGTFTMMIAV